MIPEKQQVMKVSTRRILPTWTMLMGKKVMALRLLKRKMPMRRKKPMRRRGVPGSREFDKGIRVC
jgi:hypothetical protein